MLHWKRYRLVVGGIIQSQLDEFSDIAEAAYADD